MRANAVLGDGLTDGPAVDCHAHVFARDMPYAADAWTRPDYAFTADDLLARMDRHGVRLAVISGLSIVGTYNDYTLAQLRQHPRLRGTVIVPPSADTATLQQMQADGVVGIRLQLARSVQLPDLGGAAYQGLLGRVRDLGWHVHIAVEGQRLRPLLQPLLASGVDVVIDHFGHPDPADPLHCDGFHAMLAAVQTGRCWVKLAAGFRLPGPEAWREDPDGDLEGLAAIVAAELLARVGPDRLLWGSDAPFVGYEARVTYAGVLASYRRWVPDPAMRAQIDRTALALYFR